MRKRWSFLWMVALVSFIFLAACSGGEATNTRGGNGNDDREASSGQEEITLKFVHWINEDAANWESVIETYEAENLGIKIESEALVNNMSFPDYLQKLDLMTSAGEDVDIMMFANASEYQKRVESGMIAPIDEFLDEEGVNLEEIYELTFPIIQGNYHALPMKNNTSLVMLNKDHLDEAGLEVPEDWTWEEYREYANELTADNRFGSYFYHTQDSLMKTGGVEKGDRILKEDGTSNISDPLVRESLEFRYTLEQEDESSTPYAEIISQQMDLRQQFFSGQVSMVPIASYMLTEWGQYTPDFTMAWAPWPKNDHDDDGFAVITSDLISIAENSDHKKEAYDFIRWLSTEGIVEQGIWIPSWKDANLDEVLPNLVEGTPKPEAIHLESLINALSIREGKDPLIPTSYDLEANSIFDAEVELYLLGEQDLDTTIESLEEKISKLVEDNQ